jgi:hypothetical protein
MKNFKKVAIAATCTALLGGFSGVVTTANAANWLMLQGTEAADAAPRVKVWGFIQAQYQKDFSDPNSTGGYVPAKLIGPNLTSQSAFNVNRARIGLRGQGMPLDGKVNYFLLAELGNNAITAGNNGATNITDASITFNYIKGARIRLGLFKTPGAEEALQAIHVFDYINFTTVANQMLLERFASSGDTNQGATATPNANTLNKYNKPVGAFRDVGIQIFDTFKSGGWEHSYAAMIGNGNGLNFGDNDDNQDTYLYWASEKVFAGKGGRRQGLKIFAWNQSGKRIDAVSDETQSQTRTRSGFGVKYLKKPFRVTAEVMNGKGMIFQGPHRPGHIYNDEKASGYYVDLGWYIPNTKWELDLRYDSYTRGENHPTSAAGDETRFLTTTVGVQYHFNKKTRLNMEYAMRDFESDTAAIETQATGVGGRFAVQLTHIF